MMVVAGAEWILGVSFVLYQWVAGHYASEMKGY